jgi:hypothetical protein
VNPVSGVAGDRIADNDARARNGPELIALYDKAAATLAWERTIAFCDKNLKTA